MNMSTIQQEIRLAMERSEVDKLAEKLFNIFSQKHKEVFSEWFKKNGDYDQLDLPDWNGSSEDIKKCWIEVARATIESI
jgi:hypothetical protein